MSNHSACTGKGNDAGRRLSLNKNIGDEKRQSTADHGATQGAMAKTARAERALAAASSGCEATRAEPHLRRPLPGAGSLAKPGRRGRAAQRRPPEKPRPAFRRTGRGGGDLTDPAPRGDCSPPRETEARSFPPPAPQYSTHHEKARKQPGLRETQTKVTLGHLDARGTNGVGTAQASMAQHKPGDTSCGGGGEGSGRRNSY